VDGMRKALTAIQRLSPLEFKTRALAHNIVAKNFLAKRARCS
jgi:hypothetical protein